MKPACLLALALLLPAFGDPPVLPDASLDNLWFKLTIKTKGKTINGDGTELGKDSFTTTSFLHFVLNEPIADGEAPQTNYAIEAWNELTPDTWTSSDLGTVDIAVSSKDSYFVPDLHLVSEDPVSLSKIAATLLVHVKRDKQGVVTSGQLSTLGCEVILGASSGTNGFLYGTAKLNGKTVAEAALPFTP